MAERSPWPQNVSIYVPTGTPGVALGHPNEEETISQTPDGTPSGFIPGINPPYTGGAGSPMDVDRSTSSRGGPQGSPPQASGSMGPPQRPIFNTEPFAAGSGTSPIFNGSSFRPSASRPQGGSPAPRASGGPSARNITHPTPAQISPQTPLTFQPPRRHLPPDLTQSENEAIREKDARKKAKREAKEQEKARKKSEAHRIQDEAVQKLTEQLKLGRLAICVGSGVTLYSAPSQAQRLSWWGLMNNALDYYEDQASTLAQEPINQSNLNSARKMLQHDNPTEADREDVANKIQKLLANRVDLEATWLRAQFKNLYQDYVEQLEILDALKGLQQNGALLFTTNYDDLLEKHCGLEPIDATDPNGLISWRRGSRAAVFHPHGYWRNTNHIVLSAEQYYRVKHEPIIQETLQHILASKTVLFVGCGGGLSDPNFGPLIQWIGEKNVGAGYSHYILLQAAEGNPVTKLPLIHLRCENFDAIPRFLKDLLPSNQRREGTIDEVPDDRERKKIDHWLQPVDQAWFLNDVLNLQGPNRFDRQVTQSQDVWNLNFPSRVLVTGEQGWGKTMFCASVIHHTSQNAQLATLLRTRDSLAYFFAATYQPHQEAPIVDINPFNTFLRTVISQLTPPNTVHSPLRDLYALCTRHHPVRLPTDSELKNVLIEILTILDKARTPKEGQAESLSLLPGNTYMVIDEVGTMSPCMRDQYSRFIRQLANLRLQHFHLLVAADSLVSVGVAPPARPAVRVTPPKSGRKGKSKGKGKGKGKAPAGSVGAGKDKGKGKATHPSINIPPGTPGLSAASWYTISLDWITTSTAMIEWIRHCFARNPSLAIYGNLRSEIVYDIYKFQQNFRWVYWKLDQLGRIGQAASDLNDDELRTIALECIDEKSDDGNSPLENSVNGGDKTADGDEEFVTAMDPDDDDIYDISPRTRAKRKAQSPWEVEAKKARIEK
ncbi:SIR2-like domain-containing protein [Astrocystis sublimbata]|nr:SIR2-like domain-containing protein [Astrocystis sublimbata]